MTVRQVRRQHNAEAPGDFCGCVDGHRSVGRLHVDPPSHRSPVVALGASNGVDGSSLANDPGPGFPSQEARTRPGGMGAGGGGVTRFLAPKAGFCSPLRSQLKSSLAPVVRDDPAAVTANTVRGS